MKGQIRRLGFFLGTVAALLATAGAAFKPR
jgi:hypothetical protein